MLVAGLAYNQPMSGITLGGTAKALVSGALEDELRQKVQRAGVVIWFDGDGAYTAYVDARPAECKPQVLGYRGSFLELMLTLEPLTGGVTRPELVVHLSAFNEALLQTTPLLELLASGVSFRRSLDTLITNACSGRVSPDMISAFVATKPTLALADDWLAARIAESGAGIKSQLVALSPGAFVDELIGKGPLAQRVGDPLDRVAMLEQATIWLGLTDAWREATFDSHAPFADAVVFSMASFALAVEYVFDLKRPPFSPRLVALRGLARPLREACEALAKHLRRRHPELYQRIADHTEMSLPEEVEHAVATDLGQVDTFRFEEDKVLAHALDALEVAAYDDALGLAKARTGVSDNEAAQSFWTRAPERRAAWLVVADAARLGRAALAAPVPTDVGSLEGLVDAYVAHGAAVDAAHRLLEQRRVTTLFPELPYFEVVRRRADAMRGVWVDWADGWARAMAEACKVYGFLPAPRRRQRALFEDVVMAHIKDARATPKKGAGDVPTALFVVDALRFEMAQDLFAEMAAVPHTEAKLEARLAELPTLTAVGMNAIAPAAMADGTLRPILNEGASKIGITGFNNGAFNVDTRAARWRAMFERAGGDGVELSLDQVVSEDVALLKRRVARARLVVVHSLELDDAGESGVGPLAFDPILQKLRAAWRLLREADVRRFVVTSDHGFLILDGVLRAPEVQGRKIDPERRHQLTRNAANEPGRVRVALGQLGYLGADGVHLVLSETTNVFDRGQRSASFVHGGNSLQERVVPVISVWHRSASGGSAGQYVIAAQKDEGVQGMHRLSGEVRLSEASQMSLAFTLASEVDIALSVVDDSGVVEIVHAGGAKNVAASTLRATVGKRFEVFFRVSGTTRERVRVALAHVGVLEVEGLTLSEHFEAQVVRGAVEGDTAASTGQSWLDVVQAEYRVVYAWLDQHGVIDESEVIAKLGGRGARKFATAVEVDRDKLPFLVRVEVANNGKRWVRDGGR